MDKDVGALAILIVFGLSLLGLLGYFAIEKVRELQHQREVAMLTAHFRKPSLRQARDSGG